MEASSSLLLYKVPLRWNGKGWGRGRVVSSDACGLLARRIESHTGDEVDVRYPALEWMPQMDIYLTIYLRACMFIEGSQIVLTRV